MFLFCLSPEDVFVTFDGDLGFAVLSGVDLVDEVEELGPWPWNFISAGFEMGFLGRKLFEFQTKYLFYFTIVVLKGYRFLCAESIWSFSQADCSEDLFGELAVTGSFKVEMEVFVAEENFISMNGVVSQVGYLKIILVGLKGKDQDKDVDLIFCCLKEQLGCDFSKTMNIYQVFEAMPNRNWDVDMANYSHGFIYGGIEMFDLFTKLGEAVDIKCIIVVPSLEPKACRGSMSALLWVECCVVSFQRIASRSFLGLLSFVNELRIFSLKGNTLVDLEKYHMLDGMNDGVIHLIDDLPLVSTEGSTIFVVCQGEFITKSCGYFYLLFGYCGLERGVWNSADFLVESVYADIDELHLGNNGASTQDCANGLSRVDRR